MRKEYVMGNSAIALGALCSGVKMVAGYPGTPSTEIIETIFHVPHEGVHLEWSVNEKAAMEVCASASYAGFRSLVTMKQVGLNVASDPLMSLAYVGVKGGMVIVVADDPGPISSQTEQDTRRFAQFARIPVFDPSSPEQAFSMVQDAFWLSEKYHTPVILRPTTRVCHGYASIEFDEHYEPEAAEGFIKDSLRWVIFPKLSRKNHELIEKRNVDLSAELSAYRFNTVLSGTNPGRKAVFASGISYSYAREYLNEHQDFTLVQIGTAFPFPEAFAEKILRDCEEVICLEELSPLVEEALLQTAGRHQLKVGIRGKLSGDVPHAGELSVKLCAQILDRFFKKESLQAVPFLPDDVPPLPVRPPVLCAGCPHRGAFYAVKVAMRRKKAYYCGDIGCYTLGNAQPLDMVDTCLCMGAGITMSQGFSHVDNDAVSFAFIGDSTFFASGITGIVNAIYNEANIIVCILDNSTTAMTGHQPHPGTGFNLMGRYVDRLSIEKILEGLGVSKIVVADPANLKASVAAVKECAKIKGVKAIIFRSPCISIVKSAEKCVITDKCKDCGICIKQLGCPAVITEKGRTVIDQSLCVGCSLCSQICPYKAIEKVKHE